MEEQVTLILTQSQIINEQFQAKQPQLVAKEKEELAFKESSEDPKVLGSSGQHTCSASFSQEFSRHIPRHL